jgi:hypothetical protein
VLVDHGRLWSLTADGRLHRVSPPLAAVDDVDALPGGGLLAVSGGALHRLPAGAASWEPLFTPPAAFPPALRAAEARTVTHSRDGRILVGGTYLSWLLEPDGRVTETLEEGGGEGVAVLRDGTVALLTNYGGLVLRSPNGRLRRNRADFDAALGDLLALDDGSLLVAHYGELLRIDPMGRVRPYFEPAPRLGNGDGGALRHAQLLASALAAGPRGELVVADGTASLLRGGFVMQAYARPGGWVAALDTAGDANVVRIVARRPGTRSMAAISPRTYRTLADQTVWYRSTVAGRARLEIDGRVLVRFRARAGTGRIRVPRLAPGDHRLALTIEDGPRAVTARLAVSTRRQLDHRLARSVLKAAAERSSNGDATQGTLGSLRDCTARGPVRLDCGLWLTPYDEFERADPPFCGGVWSARQRPDGLRFALLRARRGSNCREPIE